MSVFDTKKEKHYSGALRCAEKRFNENFIKKGTIKFGTPKKWEEDGKKFGPGRGDQFEGTFASCNFLDIENITKICKKYNIPNENIEIMRIGKRIYYKNKSSLLLPTFCLYGISYDLFEIEPKVGCQKIKGIIPGEYFKAFSNGEPSVVLIKNLKEFKNRLYQKLLSIGIHTGEIISSNIFYYDYFFYGKYGWFELAREFPYELTMKEKQFEYQSEIRFIINSKNEELTDFLRNNTIDIGDLSDIAICLDGYFSDGLKITLDINIGEKEEQFKSC